MSRGAYCFTVTTSPAAKSRPVTVVWDLDPVRGLYEILVENRSGAGHVATFSFVAPTNMQVVGVGSSVGGRCRLAAGRLSCLSGKAVRFAELPKGSLLVMVTMTGNAPYWNGTRWTYLFDPAPTCNPDQTSTATMPCQVVVLPAPSYTHF